MKYRSFGKKRPSLLKCRLGSLLHVVPQAQVDNRLLVRKVTHALTEELRARVDGFLRLEDAGHGIHVVDDASALGVLFLVPRREVSDISIVWRRPCIVIIGLST